MFNHKFRYYLSVIILYIIVTIFVTVKHFVTIFDTL